MTRRDAHGWSRARRWRTSSITRPRCSTNGGSTSGRSCSTDDACYYVPPNDQPESDHRHALFLIADDRERIRQRVIRIKIPTAMPNIRNPAPGA